MTVKTYQIPGAKGELQVQAGSRVPGLGSRISALGSRGAEGLGMEMRLASLVVAAPGTGALRFFAVCLDMP